MSGKHYKLVFHSATQSLHLAHTVLDIFMECKNISNNLAITVIALFQMESTPTTKVIIIVITNIGVYNVHVIGIHKCFEMQHLNLLTKVRFSDWN